MEGAEEEGLLRGLHLRVEEPLRGDRLLRLLHRQQRAAGEDGEQEEEYKAGGQIPLRQTVS